MPADHLHPVPTPPSHLSERDRFYEWLLSDHPAAAGERIRRRLDHQLREAHQLHRLRTWTDKIDRLLAAGEPVSDPIRGLHELATRRLLPDAQQRLTDAIARPDTPERLERERQALEVDRQAEDPDYRYPDHYRGPAAADQPIPPDPGRRPHDPALPAEVGERVAEGLAAEAHPAAWMRELAITARAREAFDRSFAHPQAPAPARTAATRRTPAAPLRPRARGRGHNHGGRGR